MSAGDGSLEGYAVFQKSSRADKINNGYIFDIQAVGSRADAVASKLIAYATDALRNSGAWTVTFEQVSENTCVPEPILYSHGFVRRWGHRLLVRLRDSEKMKTAGKAESWSYVYGDAEASHFVC